MSHPVIAAHGLTPSLCESWTFDPWMAAPLALAAGIYLRGWWRLHAQVPQRFGAGQLMAFLGGLATIAVALESPLHALGAQLLQVHMIQHVLLLMVAPPLIWLGAPLVPMLHGLPRRLWRTSVGPLVASPLLTRSCRWLVYPTVAWALFVGNTWAWHTPVLYGQALASETWHYAQHASFFATALVFWWPVVQPWPSRPLVPPWAIVCYLILADLQNTVLSAWLVFSERLVYAAYDAVPRLWQISAIDDQAAAGAIMWVPGSIAFLLPVAWIIGRVLSPQPRSRYAHNKPDAVMRSPQPVMDERLRLGSRQEGETW
jgi:cytochrome c oxidase assembly factor CtaG